MSPRNERAPRRDLPGQLNQVVTRRWAPVLAVVLGVGGIFPMPAAAQSIEPPAGCTAFLTVQMKGCSVSHYWRCEGDPEGASWSATYDADGPVSLSRFDREFQWLDSHYVATATREFLLEPAEDPASLSELLDSGRDTYDFVIREQSPDGTRDVRHKGYDELSGRTATIDGVELLETVFSSRASDADTGDELYTVTGRQYVLAEERLFFLGADTFVQNGSEVTSDNSPMRFHHPGDRAFGEMTPLFDCSTLSDISMPLARRPDREH